MASVLAPHLAAASDASGQILGTDLATILARAPSIIAGNLSRTGYGAHIAHEKLQANPPASFCQSRPTAARRAICTEFGTLWHEFVTTPACQGRAKCASASTFTFMAKNKQWAEVIERALTWTVLTYEGYNWCMNNSACIGTFENIGNQCNAADGYCQGTVPDIDLPDLSTDWGIEQEGYTATDPLRQWYAELGVGYFEWSLGYAIGAGNSPAIYDSYDAQWGYGGWGVLTEQYLWDASGEGNCPIVTPGCP